MQVSHQNSDTVLPSESNTNLNTNLNTTTKDSTPRSSNKNGEIKTGVIVYLVLNILFAILIIWLLYRGITDDPKCLSRIPLITISVIWLISILIQLAGSSFALYILSK